jgi:hypothetical protein
MKIHMATTNKTPQTFYVTYVGKRIDDDGAYGVQCVDAFRVLCKYLGIPVKPTPNNYADGYWIYRDSLGYSKYFDYVTDWKKLQNGDVVIWKRGSKSHPSSHIAMYYLGKEFGQNQGSNREFLLKSTDFTDMLGALRPKQWVKESVMANVLFIGNSYTYKPNDKDCLPQAFKAVCKANGVNVAVAMIAEGGWTLEKHWNNSATITAIKSKKYKYIVIQGQSDEVGCRNGKLSASAKTYGVKLGNLAKQYGAKVFFLSQSDYYYRTSGSSKTYFNMKYQDSVDANYRIIANACGAWVSCGGKKVKATANGQYASYFASDGYHPTAKAQKVVAQALWGSMMNYLKPAPAKITYVHATGVASYYNKNKGGTYKVVAKDGLHIRNDGYQSAKSLAVLPYGTEFKTYGYYDKDSQGREWFYGVARKGNVEYTGFCCAKSYLKKV